MSGHAVAQLDAIDVVSDGRCPLRPIRHHFGITAFGVNSWTAHDAGDRIVNEHDEDEGKGNEERRRERSSSRIRFDPVTA